MSVRLDTSGAGSDPAFDDFGPDLRVELTFTPEAA